MIEPFEEKQVRTGVISYGVSSMATTSDRGRVQDLHERELTIVDPKNMIPRRWWTSRPRLHHSPNSFALGRTVEYFRLRVVHLRRQIDVRTV
jgi:dCTP deaminase